MAGKKVQWNNVSLVSIWFKLLSNIKSIKQKTNWSCAICDTAIQTSHKECVKILSKPLGYVFRIELICYYIVYFKLHSNNVYCFYDFLKLTPSSKIFILLKTVKV